MTSHFQSSGGPRQPLDTSPTGEEFDLFNLPPETVHTLREQSTAELFEQFHAHNPHVYDVIVQRAREWRAAGNGKLGMSLLFGVVRWVLALETKGDPFRLNDHYVPYYSRLIMWQEPDLAGIFNLRTSEEADAWIEELKGQAA